jgi:UDP-glucose 4-epimerase
MDHTTEHQYPKKNTNSVNKAVLVVGGAGYIGSHISKHLVRNGYTPVIVDRNIKDNPIAQQFNDVYEINLPKDIHLLDDIVKRYNIDSFICTAAYTSVGESVREPNKYYQNNVVMMLQLLNKMKELNVKKIIFSSSAAVYGIPETGICYDNQTGLEPINPYGQTKLIVEKMLKDYNRAYGINSISFRYFNAAGADPEGEIGELHDPETHIIPLIIRAGFQAQDFSLFGNNYDTPDGTCIRDYVHVTDIADAQIEALKLLDENICETLNLGSGNGFSNKEIIDEVSRHTGAINIISAEKRPGDPAQLIADISRTQKILNWKPSHSSIDNVVRTAVQWYKTCNKKEIN